jgi:hypothetical protein
VSRFNSMTTDLNQKQSRQQRSFKSKDDHSRDQYEYSKSTRPHKKEKYNDWKKLATWDDIDD